MKAINVNLKRHREIFTATEKGCFALVLLQESESSNCCLVLNTTVIQVMDFLDDLEKSSTKATRLQPKKNIDLLEDTQKFALKICTKSWDSNYDELLSKAKLPTLQARQQQFKLCLALNDFAFFPNAPLQGRPLHYQSRTVHNRALIPELLSLSIHFSLCD